MQKDISEVLWILAAIHLINQSCPVALLLSQWLADCFICGFCLFFCLPPFILNFNLKLIFCDHVLVFSRCLHVPERFPCKGNAMIRPSTDRTTVSAKRCPGVGSLTKGFMVLVAAKECILTEARLESDPSLGGEFCLWRLQGGAYSQVIKGHLMRWETPGACGLRRLRLWGHIWICY